ncbi:polysaccharide biosynthesis/export family protein [Terriglobus sp.]|uniref:polysaccharide biosynthesis/export family protein n=1 Tax=Terriglobus sp. TaxID=1889013 RepID=UPI003AFF6151
MLDLDKKRFFALLLLFALLRLSCVAEAFGQATLQRREAPSAEYSLGPGDQVRIMVADVDNLPDRPIRIDPVGQIDLPLVGTVQAAGLTPEQLRAALQTKFAKYVTDPQVTVNVAEYESRPVSVLGSVTHAGVYQMTSPKHLVDVLSLAGGTAPDAGATVVVTRQTDRGSLSVAGLQTEKSGSSSIVHISLNALTSGSRPSDNILIQPDDVITVPKAEVIYVLGNVRRAGGFSLASHPSMTVLQAVTLAEGFTPNAAASHARILRKVEENAPAKEIKVDASRILAGKEPDQPLFANDILFIPNSAWKASSKRALEAAIGVSTAAAIYR